MSSELPVTAQKRKFRIVTDRQFHKNNSVHGSNSKMHMFGIGR